MPHRTLLIVSAALILALSVTPKVFYYARFDANRYAVGEPRVMAFFERQKWTLAEAPGAEGDGSNPTKHFVGPGCEEGADVTVVSPNGQDNAWVERLMTPNTRIFYLDRGQVTKAPPRFGIMNRWMGELAESLGLSAFRPYPVIAVIEPAMCELESTLPWSEL